MLPLLYSKTLPNPTCTHSSHEVTGVGDGALMSCHSSQPLFPLYKKTKKHKVFFFYTRNRENYYNWEALSSHLTPTLLNKDFQTKYIWKPLPPSVDWKKRKKLFFFPVNDHKTMILIILIYFMLLSSRNTACNSRCFQALNKSFST